MQPRFFPIYLQYHKPVYISTLTSAIIKRRFDFYKDTYYDEKENAPEGSYLIPLIHISQVEVMKAFLIDLNDRVITNAFKDLSDKDIWSRFWNEFDDDGIRSGRWSA